MQTEEYSTTREREINSCGVGDGDGDTSPAILAFIKELWSETNFSHSIEFFFFG